MKIAFATAAAALAASAASASVSTSFLDTDADFVNVLNSGVTELWTAQGRIGNAALNGDQEFDLGFTSAAPTDQRQFTWQPGLPVPFDVSYDAGTDVLQFTGDGTPVMSLPSAGAATEVYIRLRATNQRPGLGIDISDIQIDIPSQSIANMPLPSIATDNITLDGVEYLVISGLAGQSFSLNGTVTLAYDAQNPPSGSNLAFQIKGAIPTPGTVGLVGFAGIAAARRKR